MPALVTISSHQKVGAAIDLMQRYSISQLPVVRDSPSTRSPTSSVRCRTATRRSRLQEPGRAAPGRRGGDAAAAGRGDVVDSLDEVFATSRPERGGRRCRGWGRRPRSSTRSDLLEHLVHQRSAGRNPAVAAAFSERMPTKTDPTISACAPRPTVSVSCSTSRQRRQQDRDERVHAPPRYAFEDLRASAAARRRPGQLISEPKTARGRSQAAIDGSR